MEENLLEDLRAVTLEKEPLAFTEPCRFIIVFTKARY
jgi:hypothetical protein